MRNSPIPNHYQVMVDNSPALMWMADTEGGCTFVNRAWTEFTGKSLEYFRKDGWLEAVHPDDRESCLNTFHAALKREISFEMEYRVRRIDGVYRWLIDRGVPIDDEDGNFAGYVGICTDVTERKDWEKGLVEKESFLEQAQEVGRIGSWIAGLQDQSLYWSKETSILFGHSDQEYHGNVDFFFSFVHPDDVELVHSAVRHAIETNSRYSIDHRIVRKDGEIRWVHEQAKVYFNAQCEPVRLIGIVQDITEKRKSDELKAELEERMQHAQKMESIGLLAGGVAHDFNNLLSPIIGYAELIIKKFSSNEQLISFVQPILEAGRRSKTLVSQLLAFGRKQRLNINVINLNTVVKGFQPLLQRVVGEDVEIKLDLKDDLGNVRADQGQIEQILLNLALNARDAMPGGGCITIEAFNKTLKKDFEAEKMRLTSGHYAVIALSDTGTGIDSNTLPRIFEPFFSTKPRGSGTGLGLASVYGIVQQHNGGVLVASQLGKGTRFDIYLPIVEEMCGQATVPIKKSLASGAQHTVLIVEDEAMVRSLISDVLREQGYKVIVAAHPEEALETVEKLQEKIDLLLTDIVMPKMNGTELYHRLSSIRPDLKVLYTSGYSDQLLPTRGTKGSGPLFLAKPFSIESLLEKVNQALTP